MTVARSSGALRLLATRQGWTDERELAHAIHGTVIGAAVTAAASLHGTLGETVATVLVTLAVFWLSERYASILAAGVHGPTTTWSRVGRSLREGWPMLQAAVAPLVVLVVATLATSELETGVDIALAFTVALLGVLGWRAARRGGRTGTVACVWAVATGLLGVVVAALHAALH